MDSFVQFCNKRKCSQLRIILILRIITRKDYKTKNCLCVDSSLFYLCFDININIMHLSIKDSTAITSNYRRALKPLTYNYGHNPQCDDRTKRKYYGHSTYYTSYYTSRANGSKAAQVCLRFRPKILIRKS